MNNIIVLMGYDVTNGIIIITGYAVLLLTSGVLVRSVLSKISHKEKKEIAADNQWDTGAVIGKCENILIITFILSNEFTAFTIFHHKSIIQT